MSPGRATATGTVPSRQQWLHDIISEQYAPLNDSILPALAREGTHSFAGTLVAGLAGPIHDYFQPCDARAHLYRT